jgi:Type ISP C-terminal specificity domain/N-6 DNA Methylase
MFNPVTHFLQAAHSVHATSGGTKETSYYTAINNLLDAVGDGLKPKVRCVMQLKNLGAGNPDGGLFTADQFKQASGKNAPQATPVLDLGALDLNNSVPSRGVLEVKAPAEAVDDTAATAQVSKYFDRYKLVLVTNLRDWMLIGERNIGGHNQRVTLERFSLAESEAAFWALCQQGAKAKSETSSAFLDFLERVLTHNAPLADPKDLAALLASYAREARHRVECATDTAAKQLDALKQSLETALGVTFVNDGVQDTGGHFFRSTLVQTLFYGVFSAWVLEREQNGKLNGAFNWRSAAHSLNVPMIAALFGQLSQPAKLKALNLTEVLDWATDALNRVDEAAFFTSFETTRAIQYFYEPFLAAFDPVLRKNLGVWYTPEEIVRYQVARVDQVLQTELGLADGLADESVVVLDPCCGTGAYLVETLRLIATRLKANTSNGLGDALTAQRLKDAVKTRLFGFELLPAPYVVAHLQMGLLLRQMGAPLGVDASGEEERAGVYLTNALTGWEPPKEPKNQVLPFPEFEQERDAADKVKREQKIIVIIGNPPYDAFGGVAQGEEQDLVAPYKEGLIQKWGIKKFNLDDLYVRFFRLAERRIAERGGMGLNAESAQGVVCFISNYSYVREPSFVVMREHLQNNFSQIWIDNLNGDSRETGKKTPEGKPDPSAFSTPYNKAGIKKGTAIALMVKKNTASSAAAAIVRHKDWWGRAKREELLSSLDTKKRDKIYDIVKPNAKNRFSFKTRSVSKIYAAWPSLQDLAPDAAYNGLFEKRGGALVAMDKASLLKRMQAYFDPAITWETLVGQGHLLTVDSARFEAKQARQKLLSNHQFTHSNVVRYCVRPFDIRYCYRTIDRPLWSEPRPRYQQQLGEGRGFLTSRPNCSASPEGFPISFTRITGDHDWIRGHAYHFALQTHHAEDDLLGTSASSKANLSKLARNYLKRLNLPDPDADKDTAELIWLHALAIGYSPAYLADNTDGIRENWPRVPLPESPQLLLASAALGLQVAALLDTETPVLGVTTGTIRSELKSVAVVTRVNSDGKGAALQASEFALTAGWGSFGKAGVTMPGKGRVERTALRQAQGERNNDEWPDGLNIYLNDHAYWQNVPQAAWDFTIGGYQVMKKWLSYREERVLGRSLLMEEMTEVTHMARRLTALVTLQAALDENYEACAASVDEDPPASFADIPPTA